MKKFLKCIFFLSFFIFTFFNNLFSEKTENNNILEIKIKGLSNYSESIVLKEIKTKKKEILDSKKIEEDIKNILNTGYFDDISVDTEETTNGIILVYKVVEKPMVQSIKFTGNDKFTKSNLMEQITNNETKKDNKLEDNSVDKKIKKIKKQIDIKPKSYYDEQEIMIAKDKIEEFLKEEGYIASSVDYIVKEIPDKNMCDITFYISEGDIFLLNEINIKGLTEFSLKKILKTFGLKKKKVFKESLYKKGIESIKALYKEEGFLDIEIIENRIISDDKNSISIFLEFQEGNLYKFRDIDFYGNEKISTDELKKLLEIKSGDYFKESKFEISLYKIRNYYAEKGYIRSSVDPEIIYNSNESVSIKFNIVENEIVYIDRIYIDGNNITKDYVIRREFVVKEKSIFDINKVKRSQEKIFNLGFFKDVNINMEPKTDDKVDLIFKVEEQPTGMATVGGGYSSEDGVIGTLQLSKNNLFGKGQKVNLLWEFGKTRQNAQLSFTDPYIFKSNIAFGVDIFNMKRYRDYVYTQDSGYTRTDIYREYHRGGAIKFGKKIFTNSNISLGYSFDRVEITEVDDDDSVRHKPLKDESDKGEQDTSSITLTLYRDTRDNIYYTKKGNFEKISIKKAGTILGGDNDFIKVITNGSIFFPLFWEFVLAFNVDLGFVKNIDDSINVPIYERFYIGGADTIRGYDYRGDIGPEDGGNYRMIYNIEYKFPIVREKKQTILQGAFFFDIGGSWSKREDICFKAGRDENNMKRGIGFGIRFTTPVFPIRLDWGYGLDKKEGEKPSQFYFTVGQIF